ncbi:MAG: hypothetical protein R3Y46_01645 [Opitutales bacterium]
MNWTKITQQDLENALNKNQVELLKAEELKSAGSPISEEIISMIVAEIRAKIASYPANFLDYDHAKIPKELKLCALRLAIEALQSRLPSMEMTAQQKKMADISRTALEEIYTGKICVSHPDKAIKTASEKKGAYYSKTNKSAYLDIPRKRRN